MAGKKKRDESGAAVAVASPAANAEGIDTVFVKGLPFTTTEDDIWTMFGECGTVKSVYCLTFEDTGKFRGMAKVTFSTPAEAAASCEAKNGLDVGGRSIGVELSQPRSPRTPGGGFAGAGGDRPKSEPSATLFMGNLSYSVRRVCHSNTTCAPPFLPLTPPPTPPPFHAPSTHYSFLIFFLFLFVSSGDQRGDF